MVLANLVSNAIPFKRGALTNVRNFRILAGSTEVCTWHEKVLAVWPQDGSIRSVLVGFFAPKAKAYALESRDGVYIGRYGFDSSVLELAEKEYSLCRLIT